MSGKHKRVQHSMQGVFVFVLLGLFAVMSTLMVLLGDSIEYLLDDDAWLYLDDIQNEVSFDFSQEDVAQHKCIEKEIGDYHYLLVILDYKNQRSVSETNEEKAAARMMLLNQRKQQVIKQHVDQLYEKALKSGSVTQ